MFRHQVRKPEQAWVYLIDCTLATVCSLASLKSRSQYEFKRQKSMAQTAIDWAVQFGVDLSSTRGAEVLRAGSVEEWSKQYDVREQRKEAA
jgi:hypothetical protein